MIEHMHGPASDLFDVLRIIAKDARGIDRADREIIKSAADELEHLARLLISTQEQLIESNSRRIATNEALLEFRRKAIMPISAPVELSYVKSTPLWRVTWGRAS